MWRTLRLPRVPIPGVIIAVALIFVSGNFLYRPLAWLILRQYLQHRFFGVRQVSADSLDATLRRNSPDAPLLLDARTPAEFAISHLPGARRVDFDGDVSAQLHDVPADRAIIAYCSVGYRSSILAAKLQRAGFRNVRNLDGSIFAWANENRPLADGATTVHPYNNAWGTLLNPAVRAQIGSGATPPIGER